MKRFQHLAVLSLLGLLGAVASPEPLSLVSAAHATERHADIAQRSEAGQDPADRDQHGHAHAHDERGQDHDDHAGHRHEGQGAIDLKPEVMREFGIEVRVAAAGALARTVRLPGEVAYNADHLAHVRPTVAGSVQQVFVSVGDRVEAGQPMAVLNSRELAAARSQYLAARARLELASQNLSRDRRLLSDKVGTERAVVTSRQAFREAQIELNQAENALHALGYSPAQIAKVAELADTDFNSYEMLAPLRGLVTRRHLTIGELVAPDDEDAPMVVADLSSVWINLTVYQRDLGHVRAGQRVTIEAGGDIPDAAATIAFVSPALDEVTRTAAARVVLDNPHGAWRPGLFVSGLVETGEQTADLVVPASALTELDGETVVFVQTQQGFVPRHVVLGRVTPQAAEILDGLAPGERYASDNVLVLKSEFNRAALEHAGHVH